MKQTRARKVGFLLGQNGSQYLSPDGKRSTKETHPQPPHFPLKPFFRSIPINQIRVIFNNWCHRRRWLLGKRREQV